MPTAREMKKFLVPFLIGVSAGLLIWGAAEVLRDNPSGLDARPFFWSISANLLAISIMGARKREANLMPNDTPDQS